MVSLFWEKVKMKKKLITIFKIIDLMRFTSNINMHKYIGSIDLPLIRKCVRIWHNIKSIVQFEDW